MITLTIDDKKILSKYSSYELKLKFMSFLKQEVDSDDIELFSVNVSDTSKEVQKAYKESFKEEFIDY